MSIQLPDEAAATVETVTVTCTVSVPRDAAGNLTDGVRARLERTDGVEAVESLDVGGLTPSLNDLTAETTATVRVGPDVDAETALSERFGVNDVAVELRGGPP